MHILKQPYLLFLGDASSPGYAKTAIGLAQWARDKCLGQIRLPGCDVDAGLPDVTIEDAVAKGAKSFIIGIAPAGGGVQDNWRAPILAAIEEGLDIVSGLHQRLNDDESFREAAERRGVRLIDVRTPPSDLPIGTGKRRSGKRLLTVGTDCAVGKKFAALAIADAMQNREMNATFRATGQTGIMIAGEGVPLDAVVADFIAGAIESLAHDNIDSHWDVIEGQGSLYHPAYAGVSLGLLHGAQADAIVLCHNPSRPHLLGFPDYPLPDVKACVERNLILGALTNPRIQCVGACINGSDLTSQERADEIAGIEDALGVPCLDPIAMGADAIVDEIEERFRT